MTKEEILEFLELPASSSENDIRVRLDEKLAYFQLLSENAPNDFLRKLHISNTEKIRNIQGQLAGTKTAHHQPNSHVVSGNYSSPLQSGNTGSDFQSPQNGKTAVAWLVRHTENQSAKTFPLYYGKNFIGRSAHVSIPTIILNDDPYVSRVHALLEVTNTNPLQIIVSDGSPASGTKPSKNGTYINGDERRLQSKMIMEENDTIQIGMTKLIIRRNNTSINKIVQEVEESDYMKTVVINIF